MGWREEHVVSDWNAWNVFARSNVEEDVDAVGNEAVRSPTLRSVL
jgi:hypothetical protein